MKTGATASIPVAMLFKKYYCHKCGERLKRQKVKKTLNPGDLGYEAAEKELFHGHRMVGKSGPISVTEYVFNCPTCGNTISFEEQEDIAAKQKDAGTHIL
jgi:predicted RNA-binding Zn-ribbon protein involved in translation (DUF1610 family)